jgi:tetratricopeptide (TPR) repeat protein
MGEESHRYRPLLISICLVAAIIAVYWPVYKYDFAKYDDDKYVTKNINIQSGINPRFIRWAFTTGYFSYWHPITWISHAIDYQLFKNWGGGHHLTNVFFHIANTLVLFYVLMRMTGAVWPSAFVAAIFALHPLHVESVAWIAERKDVLSTFFWLLTMWAYIRYVENPRLKWYSAAIMLFILGLMSKPMVVTLPFVLLLLDYWPLQRKITRRLIIEKIPFFICSFLICMVTFLVQKSNNAMGAMETLGFKVRVGNAIFSYVAYIAKMLWPSRLAVFYPHPGSELSITAVIICALPLLLISVYSIYSARRYRFLAVGWFWYLGTLVPAIGLVQAGAQAMADRYTYMTLTGLFIIIAWSAKEFVPKWRYRNFTLAFLAIMVLIASALTASRQLRYWKNSIALYEHTLQVTKNNYVILFNYAKSLTEMGRLDEATKMLNDALAINPDSAEVYDGLGCALLFSGRTTEAIEHFKLAIKYKPDFVPAYNNLAVTLYKRGRNEEAIGYLKQALKLKPNYVKAYLSLGVICNASQKFDEAIKSLNKVLELEPANIIAHSYLYTALAAIGKTDEAIKEVRFVLKVKPNDVEMYRNLGILLEKKGEITEAIESYRAALKIEPYEINTRQLLDAALKKQELP